MNRLAHTDLHVPSLFLILGTVILFFAPLSSLGEQTIESVERELLHGVTGAEVLVDPFDVEIEQLGVKTDPLQTVIKQRLQKAGVNVLTERERLRTPTAAMLTIRVNTLHDRIGRYFFSIDLFLTQRVRLESREISKLSAVTWMKLGPIGIVANDNVKHIES